MLATIILDAFEKEEAGEIAGALETLCSPRNHYAFSSAAIYAFWSIPKWEILYVGLAKDVTRRFKQHAKLVVCNPKSCKSKEMEEYFESNPRLGYTVIVQSSMCSPVIDEAVILDAIGADPGEVDVSDIFDAEQNIRLAEGMLIELYERLGDRLPPWNKQRGLEKGRNRRSFFPYHDQVRFIEGRLAGKPFDEIEAELDVAGPPYEMLLNIDGSELSDLNARATLREIAGSSTICEHELLLHGVRIPVAAGELSFEKSVWLQRNLNREASPRFDLMTEDGYWDRTVKVPGL